MNEVSSIVKSMGVVGAGGAGFPSYIKLNTKVNTVIANGAECEPLLYTDKVLMENFFEDIIAGLKIAMKSTGANHGIIAIKEFDELEDNPLQKKIYEKLSEIIKNDENLSIHKIPNFYPAGDEVVLTYEILKSIVPEFSIPPNINVLVHNVGTLLNINKAMLGTPVTHKYLTIAGEVKNPKVCKVPIGASFKEIIEKTSYPYSDEFSVIEGGPIMGKLILDLNSPVTKTTSGIIVLPSSHTIIQKKSADNKRLFKIANSICNNCNRCFTFCPRAQIGHKLNPVKIMRTNFVFEYTENFKNISLSCIECGLCTYFACNMGLSPMSVFSSLKKTKVMSKDFIPEEYKVVNFREFKRVPTMRLINRLSLTNYVKKLSLDDKEYNFKKLHIMLKQHVGSHCIPVVKINDNIKKGTILADVKSDLIGVPIHAPMDGKIIKITESEIILEN